MQHDYRLYYYQETFPIEARELVSGTSPEVVGVAVMFIFSSITVALLVALPARRETFSISTPGQTKRGYCIRIECFNE